VLCESQAAWYGIPCGTIGAAQAIKDVTYKSYEAYLDVAREKWVLDWPGQVVLTTTIVAWTKEVTDAINQPPDGLPDYLTKSNTQLDQIIQLVRGELTKLQRKTIGALVVLDVHARDVVDKLVKDKITSDLDFAWLSQLRYYFEDEQLYCRMITASLRYGGTLLSTGGSTWATAGPAGRSDGARHCDMRCATRQIGMPMQQVWKRVLGEPGPACHHAAYRPVLPHADGRASAEPRRRARGPSRHG
jgi:hypothetical protein